MARPALSGPSAPGGQPRRGPGGRPAEPFFHAPTKILRGKKTLDSVDGRNLRSMIKLVQFTVMLASYFILAIELLTNISVKTIQNSN